MVISQASRYYMERMGLVETRTAPSPRIDLARNQIHTTRQADPVLTPRLRIAENGSPSPDRGVTLKW